jgi:cutinase
MRIRLLGPALAVALLGGVLMATAAPASAQSSTAAAAACTDIDVPVARGTGEPGTLGFIVGDPVYRALQQRLTGRTTSAYRVNYPASLAAGSASLGNADLVQHVTSQAAACPNQRFILVGYSQGANVVDNSIGISSQGSVVGGPIVATIPASLQPRIAAILLFGNPIRAIGRSVTGTYAARTLDLCAAGDPICQLGGTNFLAHLSYTQNADQAAAFAAGRV